MWQFLWDIVGYFHDNVPRWVKLTILGLVLLIVFLFFGYKPMIYVAGGIFWAIFAFMLIAHIVILIKDSRKRKAAPPTPLTPADQADIREFQEAMESETSGQNELD